MNLFKSESDRYSQEQLSAREAQRQAEFIAWGRHLPDFQTHAEMGYSGGNQKQS